MGLHWLVCVDTADDMLPQLYPPQWRSSVRVLSAVCNLGIALEILFHSVRFWYKMYGDACVMKNYSDGDPPVCRAGDREGGETNLDPTTSISANIQPPHHAATSTYTL